MFNVDGSVFFPITYCIGLLHYIQDNVMMVGMIFLVIIHDGVVMMMTMIKMIIIGAGQQWEHRGRGSKEEQYFQPDAKQGISGEGQRKKERGLDDNDNDNDAKQAISGQGQI